MISDQKQIWNGGDGVITSQALASINKHRYEVPAQIIKTATHACMKVAVFLFCQALRSSVLIDTESIWRQQTLIEIAAFKRFL